MRKNPYFFSAICFAVTLLSGCATTDQAVQAPAAVSMQELLANASAASSAGKTELALLALKEAASTYPADKAPWLQMAQTHFDNAHYGPAIASAEEVLQRDPDDRLANSIIAVSGLRLSTKALADLSRQNNLSGSLRSEARDLATLLRETLGEPVLVPARSRAATTPSRPVVVVQPANRRPPPPARPAAESANANPFGALK